MKVNWLMLMGVLASFMSGADALQRLVNYVDPLGWGLFNQVLMANAVIVWCVVGFMFLRLMIHQEKK